MIRDGYGGLYPRAAMPALLRLVDEWQPGVIVRETAEFASLAVAIGRGIPRVHVAIGLLVLVDMLGGEAMEPLASVAADHGLTIPSDTSPFLDEPTLTLTPPTLDDAGAGPTHRYRDPIEPTEPDPSLAGDDPLVYLTFGTEAAGMGLYPDIYRAAIGTIAGPGRRVLATVGRSADPAALGPMPPGVRVEQWIPQDAVLPHAGVVVFHGGYGTMLGALRAGVPLVTMPLFSIDQVANARRTAERGSGSRSPGPRNSASWDRSLRRSSPTRGSGPRPRSKPPRFARSRRSTRASRSSPRSSGKPSRRRPPRRSRIDGPPDLDEEARARCSRPPRT